MENGSWTVVAAYPDIIQASIAKGLLESEGIPAKLGDEHLVTNAWYMSIGLGGVKLMSPTHQTQKAYEILKKMDQGLYQTDHLPSYRCPKCQSTDVVERKRWLTLLWLLPLMGYPFKELPKKMVCNNCKNNWSLF